MTIGDGARIESGVVLHAGVYVGAESESATETVVYPNAVIREGVRIGRRCIIHANAVIGSDGYGFVQADGLNHKVPQIGGVIIGDDVEIGACVTIDRATCGSNAVGRGTKIGNLTQVAHNVVIGEDCLIVGVLGIGGSSHIGDRVTLAGQVGVADYASLGDDVTVGVAKFGHERHSFGCICIGISCSAAPRAAQAQAAAQKVPEALREIAQLRQRIEELERVIFRPALNSSGCCSWKGFASVSLVRLVNVSKYVGARKLFGPVTVSIESGDRIGLIGRNGTGKTTCCA